MASARFGETVIPLSESGPAAATAAAAVAAGWPWDSESPRIISDLKRNSAYRNPTLSECGPSHRCFLFSAVEKSPRPGRPAAVLAEPLGCAADA
jgi:hypothetical protein